MSANDSLESKASTQNYAIQSHYDHPGWYIVWRYLVDPTESIERGRPVIVWRVDVVFLKKEDWNYEGSGAGPAGGWRTHTFGVQRPATKLRGCAVLPQVRNRDPGRETGSSQRRIGAGSVQHASAAPGGGERCCPRAATTTRVYSMGARSRIGDRPGPAVLRAGTAMRR